MLQPMHVVKIINKNLHVLWWYCPSVFMFWPVSTHMYIPYMVCLYFCITWYKERNEQEIKNHRAYVLSSSLVASSLLSFPWPICQCSTGSYIARCHQHACSESQPSVTAWQYWCVRVYFWLIKSSWQHCLQLCTFCDRKDHLHKILHSLCKICVVN